MPGRHLISWGRVETLAVYPKHQFGMINISTARRGSRICAPCWLTPAPGMRSKIGTTATTLQPSLSSASQAGTHAAVCHKLYPGCVLHLAAAECRLCAYGGVQKHN